MTLKQKFLGLTLAFILIVAIGVGASSVLAQNDGNTMPAPSPSGTSEYGWNMHGMMWGNWQDDSMRTAVANTLGIDVNTLFTELQSGRTLAQIAEERNIDVQTVYDAALATMTDHMNAMVGSGYITQAQADTQLNWMRDNITQMPMFNGTGFGPGMMDNGGHGMMGNGMHSGMMGSYGPGMMGNGMHGGMMGSYGPGTMGSGMHGGMMGGYGSNGMHDDWDDGQHHGGWGR